jgi:hypothetical protein
MARWGGGPETYRALNGPRSPEKHEILHTLQAVREVRSKIDRGELKAVRMAREQNISWTEIATCLGVTRQAAWERWHEVDAEVKAR